MRHKRSLFLLGIVLLTLAVLAGCTKATSTSTGAKGELPTKYANPDLLAETAWLAQNLGSPDIRVLDVRAPDMYKAGHIKGAFNVAITDTEAKGSKVPSEVAPKEEIEAWLGKLGVSKETKIVVYDQMITPVAGRLFWVLEYMGHPRVAVLNGGFAKWAKEKREVSKDTPSAEPTEYTASPVEKVLATKEEVRALVGKKDAVLLDTRPTVEFITGHLQGATRQDWVELLTADTPPVMKPAGELQKLMDDAGVTRDKDLVLY